jgi:hypothetical protein
MPFLFLFPFLFLVLSLGAAPALAGPVLITEVVTDPKMDHSESSGGNMVPYDELPGDGTVSSVDEFLEIYNPGPTPVDLTGYRIEFNDSTPATFVFGTSSGVLRYSPGSSLTSLQAFGYALLGNPPGAMNNQVTIKLFDASNTLVDTVVIKDGRSTGAAGESVARVWRHGEYLDRFFRDMITPLAESNPAPASEPAALLLLFVSGCAGAAARRRSVRRACDRRRRRWRGHRPRPRRSA